MGVVGKKTKKIHARENAKKKNSHKKEGKEKNHAEGRSNGDFFNLVPRALFPCLGGGAGPPPKPGKSALGTRL